MPGPDPNTVPREVAYFLAPFGRVRLTLRGASAEVYSQLEAQGELDRLAHIRQLGVVAESWRGAQHTRLDYASLMCHIAEIAKRDLDDTGLNSQVRLASGRTLGSKLTLIQCWAFLAQLGHLPWTFAAESALLVAINRSPGYRDALLDMLGEQQRPWAIRTLDDWDIYRFHQVIGMARIKSLVLDTARQEWSDLLAAYVAPTAREPRSVQTARRLFRRIRRLAFLTLDSSFTPTVLSVDLGQTMNDPYALRRLLSIDQDATSDDELASLGRYLELHVYLGRRTLEEHARRIPGLMSHFEGLLADRGVQETIESLVRPDWLQEIATVGDVASVLRLVLPYPSNSMVRQLEAEEWLAAKGAEAHPIVIDNPSRSNQVMQFHARADDSASHAAAIAWCIETRVKPLVTEPGAQELAREQPAFVGFLHNVMHGTSGRDLIQSALRAVFGHGLKWRATEPAPPVDAVYYHRGDLSMLQHLASGDGMDAPRTFEVDCVVDLASSARVGKAILGLCRFEARRSKEDATLLDLDGVIVWVDRARGELVVGILEAKRMKRSAEISARRHVAQMSGRLPHRQESRRGPIYSKRIQNGAYAWRYYRLAYATSPS